METEELEFTFRNKVAVVVVAAASLYSLYVIGRLSYDWAREGIRALKKLNNPDN